MRKQVNCAFCGLEISRIVNYKKRHFCSNVHKSEWQRLQKPVTKAWLEQKYITEGLDSTQIAHIVNRDPKSVWNWLKDFNIPTRKRGYAAKPFWFKKGQGPRLGKKLSEATKEKIRQARLRDGRIPAYINGQHWLHFYNRHPASWKGGITPERQAFYASSQWIRAATKVWQRDNYQCQKCGLSGSISINRGKGKFHIHHISSFANKSTRTRLKNLVLLCSPCHRWVHSKKNTQGEFLHARTRSSNW